MEIDEALVKRPVNEGFSGGEKKRNEIFQMAILDPRLAILDETDSGLDIDALQIVARGVNQLRDRERAMLVVTHYQRLLELYRARLRPRADGGPDRQSGGKEMALELEAKGYAWLEKEPRRRRSSSKMSLVAEENDVLRATSNSSRRSSRAPTRPGCASCVPPPSRASASAAFPPRGTSSGATRTSRRSRARCSFGQRPRSRSRPRSCAVLVSSTWPGPSGSS